MEKISEFETSELSVIVSDICCYSFLYAQRDLLYNRQMITPISGFDLTTKSYEDNGKINWLLLFEDLKKSIAEFGFTNEWLTEFHKCIDKNFSSATLQKNVEELKTGLTTLGKLAIKQSREPINPVWGFDRPKRTTTYGLITVHKIYEWDWSDKPNALIVVNKVLVMVKNLGISKIILTQFCENFLDRLTSRDSFFKNIINNMKR